MYDTFTGCAVFLTSNISLIYAAHLVTRRFYSAAPPAARLAASGTVFYALVVLTLQALSPLHAITRPGVTIASAMTALVCHLLWGKHRNIGAEIETVRLWLRDGLASRWSVLLIAGGFVLLVSLSRALLMPPMSWDSLTYHLTFAAHWVQKGSLLRFIAPDQIIENAYLPINGELFASWLMLPFHSDLLVNTVNFPLTLLGGIACYAIARELGLTRREAAFAPALLCFAPVIYAQITTAYVDNAVFAFCAASVLFTLRYLRNGRRADALLTFTASGILLGTKYTGLPIVGFVFLAMVVKRMLSSFAPGRLCGLVFAGLVLLSLLGGRQYLLNALEARNPFYPTPVTLFNHVVAEGSDMMKQVDAWAEQYEAQTGMAGQGFLEREYKKLQFLPRSAGPKFLFLLLVASLSPFVRPRHIPRRQWYFLLLCWTAPILLFYTANEADYIRKAFWVEGSTRFLSPFIAIFTIQALLLIKKFTRGSDRAAFFCAALVVWDLFSINKSHLQEVEMVYPVLVALAGLVVLSLSFMRVPVRIRGAALRWLVSACLLTGFIGGCHFLQAYRDATRYTYYRRHYDYFHIPKIANLVNGWEFLDQPNRGKRVALSVGWEPPGHIWFFYPLMGRRLQNEVLYVSPKYAREVPAWLHKNMLRGDDARLWLSGIREKKVDFVFVAQPWPKELTWMEGDPETFRPVFSTKQCKIFKHAREAHDG